MEGSKSAVASGKLQGFLMQRRSEINYPGVVLTDNQPRKDVAGLQLVTVLEVDNSHLL